MTATCGARFLGIPKKPRGKMETENGTDDAYCEASYYEDEKESALLGEDE